MCRTYRSIVGSRGLGINGLLFDGFRRLLVSQASDFDVQRGHHSRKWHHPFRKFLASGQPQLNSILMAKQVLNKIAAESFYDYLVAVNVNSPTSNVYLVFFHFFCYSAHEFAPQVHLQKLSPFQRPAFVSFFKSVYNLS